MSKDYRLIVEYNHEEKKSRIKFKFDQRTGESIPIIDPILEEQKNATNSPYDFNLFSFVENPRPNTSYKDRIFASRMP